MTFLAGFLIGGLLVWLIAVILWPRREPRMKEYLIPLGTLRSLDYRFAPTGWTDDELAQMLAVGLIYPSGSIRNETIVSEWPAP